MAHGWKGLQGSAARCHLAQGARDAPDTSLGPCRVVPSQLIPQFCAWEPESGSHLMVCFILFCSSPQDDTRYCCSCLPHAAFFKLSV